MFSYEIFKNTFFIEHLVSPRLYDKGNRATKKKWKKNAWLRVENTWVFDEDIKIKW